MASRRARDFDRWVRLSLRPGVGGLYVDYVDETGYQLTAPPLQKGSRGRRLTLWPNTPRHLPHGLEARIRSGFADRPEKRRHYLPDRRFLEHRVPWLLPVFVDPPPGAAPGLPWEDWLAADILNTPELAGRCVLMRHVPLSGRPVLQLPLRFEQLGQGAADWFSAARVRHWYTGSAAVRRFGLQFANPGDRSPSGKAQVIVRPFGTELPAWLLSQPSSMPLLVVTIAETYLSGSERSAPPPEPGFSHLFVHPHDPATTLNASAVVEQIVYALVHDFALHEIAWILAHAMPKVWTWIASDPRGIQALRLSAVMRRAIDAALAGSGPSGSSFMIGNARLHERLLRLDGDFRFESRGLTGIAEWLQEAQHWRRPARERARRESYPSEPRKADIAIERYDAFGVLSPMLRGDRLAPLVRGWRYRLRIHIGIPDRVASAVVGEVPSVDDLMSPPESDQPRPIEVAIFTKRFELLSEDVRVILLPARGASAPVYFEVRAPQEIGPADLRIALYWQNNLLQSFVLEAEVGDGTARDAKSPSERVRVRLDSSGVADFTTLPQVQGRALSVAFNDDAGAGTHTVMMKGKDWRQELSLSAADTESYTKDFHCVLAAAGPETFEATLREVARIGNRIWNQLLALRDRSSDGAVEALRVSSGATVQFMRHGGGTPFPWQTVYDYGLAEGPDYRKASICDASKPVRGAFPRGRVGCPHCPGENVICIEGFWAARHRIELLAERLKEEAVGPPRARRASAPPANPLVTLGIGTPGGVTSQFAEALERSLGTALHRIEPKDAPVTDHIWDESKRPAILAIVSHLEAGSAQDNLPTKVRAFSPSADGDTISDRELSHRIGSWKEPQRPLVLLLACGSARKRLGELTSLVDALLIVGAAGVAGTEWDVDAERATRFGSWIIAGMLDATKPQRLGEVVRGYVHQALRKRDALPFVFTVYGDADLTAGRVQP